MNPGPMTRWAAVTLALAAATAAAAPRRKPMAKTAVTAKVHVTSPAFEAGGSIPKRFTCDGEDVSPALSWPALTGAKSIALVMDDPDAPAGTWVHWVLYDLPGGLKGLEEGVAKTETLPNGAKHGASWGTTHYERVGYSGPCPPPGKAHRYFFKVYGLDKTLGLKPKATKEELLRAMQGHIVAQGELVGLYKR